MASVYDRINGKKLEKLIAEVDDVQHGLRDRAENILGKTETNLAAVRASPGYTGDFNVELSMKRGKTRKTYLDWFVFMDDPADGSSPGAAMSIEFGHHAGKRGTPNR